MNIIGQTNTSRPRQGPPPCVVPQCTTQARYQHHIYCSFQDVSRVEVAVKGTNATLDASDCVSYCDQLAQTAGVRGGRPHTLSTLRRLYTSRNNNSTTTNASPYVGGGGGDEATNELARTLGLNILSSESNTPATTPHQEAVDTDAATALGPELTFGDLLLVEKRFMIERELGAYFRREDREFAEMSLIAEPAETSLGRKDTFIPPVHYTHPDNRSPAQLRRSDERQRNELERTSRLLTAASALHAISAGRGAAEFQPTHEGRESSPQAVLSSSTLATHTINEASPDPVFPEVMTPDEQERQQLESLFNLLTELPDYAADTENQVRSLLEETAALSIYNHRSSLKQIHRAVSKDEMERGSWNMLISSLIQSVAKKDPAIKIREKCFQHYYGRYVMKKVSNSSTMSSTLGRSTRSSGQMSPDESKLQVLVSVDDGSDNEGLPPTVEQQFTVQEYGSGTTIDERDVHAAYRASLLAISEARDAVLRARKHTLFAAPSTGEGDSNASGGGGGGAPGAPQVGVMPPTIAGSRIPAHSFVNVLGLGLGYRLPGHEARRANDLMDDGHQRTVGYEGDDMDSQAGDHNYGVYVDGYQRRRAITEATAMMSSVYASPLLFDAPIPKQAPTARQASLRLSTAPLGGATNVSGAAAESPDPSLGVCTTSSGWVRWKFVGLPSTIPYFTGSYYPIDVVDHDDDDDTNSSYSSYSSDPAMVRDGSMVVRGSGMSDDGFNDGAVLQLRLSQEVRALGSFLLRCNCLVDDHIATSIRRRKMQVCSPSERARRERCYWFQAARMAWATQLSTPAAPLRTAIDPVEAVLGRWLLLGDSSGNSMKRMSRDNEIPRRPLKVYDVHMIEKLNVSAAAGDAAGEDNTMGGVVCDFTGFSMLHSYTSHMAAVDAEAALDRILTVSKRGNGGSGTTDSSAAFGSLPPYSSAERRHQQLLRIEKELLERHRDDVYCTIELYRPKQDGNAAILPEVFVDPITPIGAAHDFVNAHREPKSAGADVLGRDRQNDRFARFHRQCSQQEYQCFVRQTVLIPWATPKSTLEYTNVVVQSVEDEAVFENGCRVPLTMTSIGGGCLFIKTPQSVTVNARGAEMLSGRSGEALDDFPVDPSFMNRLQRAEVSRMGYVDLYAFVRRLHAAEAEERSWFAKHFPQFTADGGASLRSPSSQWTSVPGPSFTATDSATVDIQDEEDSDDELPIVRSPQANSARRLVSQGPPIVANDLLDSGDNTTTPPGQLPPPPSCWAGYTPTNTANGGVVVERVRTILFPQEIVHWAIDAEDVNDSKAFVLGRSTAVVDSLDRDDGLIDLDDFDGGADADDDEHQNPDAEDGFMYVAVGPMDVSHQLDALREEMRGKKSAEAIELAEHRLPVAIFNQYRYVRVPLRAVFSYQDICVATYYSRCLPAESTQLPSASPPSPADIKAFCGHRRYRQAGVFVSTLRSGKMCVSRLTRAPLSVQWNPNEHTTAAVFCAGDIVTHTALPEVIGLAQHEAIQELVDYEVEPLGHGGRHEPPFTTLVETRLGTGSITSTRGRVDSESPMRDVSPNSSPSHRSSAANIVHNRFTRVTTPLPAGDDGVDRLYTIGMPYSPYPQMHIPLGRQERVVGPDSHTYPKCPFSLYDPKLEKNAIDAANSCGHQYITCFAQSQIHGAWMASLLHIQHAPSAAVEEGRAHLQALHGQRTPGRSHVSLFQRLVSLRSVYRKGAKSSGGAAGGGGDNTGKISLSSWYPSFVRALQLLPQRFIHDDMFPTSSDAPSNTSSSLPQPSPPQTSFVMQPILRCVSIFKVPKRVTKAYYSSRDKILIMGADGGHIGVLGAGHDSWQVLFSPLRRWLSTFIPRCSNNGLRINSHPHHGTAQAHCTIALSSNLFFKAVPALRTACGGDDAAPLTPFDEVSFAVNCGRIDEESLTVRDIDGRNSSTCDRSLANSFASDGRGMTSDQHARYLARRRNLQNAHFTSNEGGLDVVVDGGCSEPPSRPLVPLVETVIRHGLTRGAFLFFPSKPEEEAVGEGSSVSTVRKIDPLANAYDLALDAVVLGALTFHPLVDVDTVLEHHTEVVATGRECGGEELSAETARALQVVGGVEPEEGLGEGRSKRDKKSSSDKHGKEKREKKSKRRKEDLGEDGGFKSYITYYRERAQFSAQTPSAAQSLCLYLLLTHRSDENVEYLGGGGYVGEDSRGSRHDSVSDGVPSLPIFDVVFHPVVDPAQVVQRSGGGAGAGGDWGRSPAQRTTGGGGLSSPLANSSRPTSDVGFSSPDASYDQIGVPEKKKGLFSRLKSKVTGKKDAPPQPPSQSPSARDSSTKPWEHEDDGFSGSRGRDPQHQLVETSPYVSDRALPDEYGARGTVAPQQVLDITCDPTEGFCDYFAIDNAYNPFASDSQRLHSPAAPNASTEFPVAQASTAALSLDQVQRLSNRNDDSSTHNLPTAVHEALSVVGIEPTIYNDMYLLTTSCAAVLVHIYVRKAEETLCELVVETQEEERSVLIQVPDSLVEPKTPQTGGATSRGATFATFANEDEDEYRAQGLESIAWDIEESVRGGRSQMSGPLLKMFFKRKAGTTTATPTGHYLDASSTDDPNKINNSSFSGFTNRSFSHLFGGKGGASNPRSTSPTNIVSTAPSTAAALQDSDQLLLKGSFGDVESDASGELVSVSLRREKRVVETVRREYRSHRQHRLFVYCVRALSTTYGHTAKRDGSTGMAGSDIVAAANAFNRDPQSIILDDRSSASEGVGTTPGMGRRGSIAHRPADDNVSTRASHAGSIAPQDTTRNTSFSFSSKVRGLMKKDAALKNNTINIPISSSANNATGGGGTTEASTPLPPVRFSLVHMHWPSSLCDADVPPFVLLSSSSVKSRDFSVVKRSAPAVVLRGKASAATPAPTNVTSAYGVGNVSAGHCVLVHPLIAPAALEATQRHHRRFNEAELLTARLQQHLASLLPPTPTSCPSSQLLKSILLSPGSCAMKAAPQPNRPKTTVNGEYSTTEYGCLPFYLRAGATSSHSSNYGDITSRCRGASVASNMSREYYCPSPAMAAQPTTIPSARVLPAGSGNVFSMFTKVGSRQSFVGCCSHLQSDTNISGATSTITPARKSNSQQQYIGSVPNVVGPLSSSPSVCRVPLIPGDMDGSTHVVHRQRYRGVVIQPPQYTGLSSESFRAALYSGGGGTDVVQQRLREQADLWPTLSWDDWMMDGGATTPRTTSTTWGHYTSVANHPSLEDSLPSVHSVCRTSQQYGDAGHSDGSNLMSPLSSRPSPSTHVSTTAALAFRQFKEQQHLADSLQLKARIAHSTRTGTPLISQLPKLLDGVIAFRYSGGASDLPTGATSLTVSAGGETQTALSVNVSTIGDFTEVVGFARALIGAALNTYQATRKTKSVAVTLASQRLQASLSLSSQLLQSAAASMTQACTPLALDRSLHSFHMGCFYLLVDGGPPFWPNAVRRKQLTDTIIQAQSRNANRARAIASTLHIAPSKNSTSSSAPPPEDYARRLPKGGPESTLTAQAELLDVCSQLLRVAEFIAPFYSGASALCMRQLPTSSQNGFAPPSSTLDGPLQASMLAAAKEAFDLSGKPSPASTSPSQDVSWLTAPPTSAQSLSNIPTKPSTGRYGGAVGGPPVASLCDGFGRKVPTGEEAMLQVTALDSRLHGLLCLVKMPNRVDDEVYLCRDGTSHNAITSMLDN